MKRLLFAAILAVAAPGAMAHDGARAAANTQGDGEAARPAVAAVEAFHAALGSGDAEAALALLAPDVMVLEEGGAERSREEYAGHHLPADMAFAAATETVTTHRAAWIEGDLAWVLTEGRVTRRFSDRPVDRLTAETMILQRHADGWRIRHIHWSSRAAN
ncbi:MAG: nuclear transport factor 2 family protein [Brevundimonas sp.]|jgi:ketosteroid isomerase-like protein|uniref:nuclear transport factor 2 family protein n=1 Tax=Brevundimonas sp. TaxID=1871086 RepID=UPI00391CE5E8